MLLKNTRLLGWHITVWYDCADRAYKWKIENSHVCFNGRGISGDDAYERAWGRIKEYVIAARNTEPLETRFSN